MKPYSLGKTQALNKHQAIKKLSELKARAEALMSEKRGSASFKKWHRDTEIAIENIFGERTRHLKDFTGIRYTLPVFSTNTPEARFEQRYREGLNIAISILDSLIDEINEYWIEDRSSKSLDLSALVKIELIIVRFHQIAQQLRSRYSSRSTIEIEDEYDVQDLFHAMLRLFFDDVRPEEYTPSYAGSASRTDFLLKNEKIIIEIKKTRRGLSAKEVGEQLIIDSMRYQSHPNCDFLVCFVYDPETRIANPRGFENDITQEVNGMPVVVFITPKL